MRAELIYNPFGGQVVSRHELENVVAFLNRCGWEVTCTETHAPMEATVLARRAVARGSQVVIAAGGDGTVSEVANGMVHTDAALGVLPMGTTNSWAMQFGIPALNPMSPGTNVVKFFAGLEERMARSFPASYNRKILLDAARVLVEGQTVAVDVGEVAGRYFLMWAGIGLDAAVVKSVSLREKRALGAWAYILNAIEATYRSHSSDVSLSLDGKEMRTSTPLIVVSNIQLYGGVMALGAKARVNDGKLDVCIFKGHGVFSFAQHAVRVLSHRHMHDPKIEYHQCSEIVVDATPPMPVHLDAEPATRTPVAIRTVPSALRAIVPRNAPRSLFAP